jgi:hypothetical protein
MEVGALRTALAGTVVDGDGASQLLTVPTASEGPRDKTRRRERGSDAAHQMRRIGRETAGFPRRQPSPAGGWRGGANGREERSSSPLQEVWWGSSERWWRRNERREGAARYLTSSGRCTVHPVRAPTEKEGGSGGLAALGGVAAELQGGAAAWRLARGLQRGGEEGCDRATASTCSTEGQDSAGRRRRVGESRAGPRTCPRGVAVPGASSGHG